MVIAAMFQLRLLSSRTLLSTGTHPSHQARLKTLYTASTACHMLSAACAPINSACRPSAHHDAGVHTILQPTNQQATPMIQVTNPSINTTAHRPSVTAQSHSNPGGVGVSGTLCCLVAQCVRIAPQANNHSQKSKLQARSARKVQCRQLSHLPGKRNAASTANRTGSSMHTAREP